ncbi:Ger(x)C family spore germination protein [Paenibacillus oryzisoli]|uniref:Ger(x)C family spore germination protein n=1 Tax=Paenibacillus oryzisoli TaxID=1850517 RepID=UPI003D287FA4
MKAIIRTALFVLPTMSLLTGCWDIKDVADYNFVTTLGIDYAKEKYIIYTELTNFGQMGNQQQGTTSDRTKMWIGKSEGDTLYGAIEGLYKTAQQYLYWDHLTTIIFSDRVLHKNIDSFIDAIPRFPQIRYNAWVFGTEEPINELIKYSTFFNLSPTSNLMHNPKALHNQLSSISPVRLSTVLANDGEVGQTDLVPSLQINKTDWEDTEKPQPVVQMNGAYALTRGKAENKFTEKQLDGARWVSTKTKRVTLPISHEGKKVAMISIYKPKKQVEVIFKDGQPLFSMHLKFLGVVEEVLGNFNVEQLKDMAEKEITDQVLQTFRIGISRGIDIYGLEQVLYRNHLAEWRKLNASAPVDVPRINDGALRTVNVEVNLSHSGMYDLEPYQDTEVSYGRSKE